MDRGNPDPWWKDKRVDAWSDIPRIAAIEGAGSFGFWRLRLCAHEQAQ